MLNLSTGLASPQFHVKFDDLFETASQCPPQDIQWIKRCGFANDTYPESPQPSSREPLTPDTISLPPSVAFKPDLTPQSPQDSSPSDGTTAGTTSNDPPEET